MALCTLAGDTRSFVATKALALFWSRRVSAVKFSLGMDGAQVCAMRALVLAGLPTTHTWGSSECQFLRRLAAHSPHSLEVRALTFLEAYWSRARPCSLKMPAFLVMRSFLSIPTWRGKDPTKSATSTFVKASFRSPVHTTSVMYAMRPLAVRWLTYGAELAYRGGEGKRSPRAPWRGPAGHQRTGASRAGEALSASPGPAFAPVNLSDTFSFLF
jgi:hypothetical protein